MNRRELLRMIGLATGVAFIGGNTLLAGCATSSSAALTFSAADAELLDAVTETILPRTDTPGARDAEVGSFMQIFVNDCYSPAEQATFHAGLLQLERRSAEEYGGKFNSLTAEQRLALINTLDSEARQQLASGGEAHYFTMIKQLTLFGFFTSEVGGTQALRHVPVPGRFDGCVSYEEGQPAWATQ